MTTTPAPSLPFLASPLISGEQITLSSRARHCHKSEEYQTDNPVVARRHASESEFRSIAGTSRVTRAAWLNLCGVCSIRVAEAALSSSSERITKTRVAAAINAIKSGRPIGQRGRPPHIHGAVEAQLIQWIKTRSEVNDAPTIVDIAEKVVLFLFSFLLFLHSWQIVSQATKLRLAATPQPLLAPTIESAAVRSMLHRNSDLLRIETPRQIENVTLLFFFLFISKSVSNKQNSKARLVPQQTVKQWFTTNEALLRSTPAGLMFNWDETMGMMTGNGSTTVVSMREHAKAVKVVADTRNEHITIGLFISGDGSVLGKYQVILPLQELPKWENKRIFKAFDCHGQKKGWVSTEIMKDIIEKVFVPGVIAKRSELEVSPDVPAVLLWDGHVSHQTEEVVKLLARHHITSVLFVLHASHLVQPLDIGIFRAYKSAIREVCCLFFCFFKMFF